MTCTPWTRPFTGADAISSSLNGVFADGRSGSGHLHRLRRSRPLGLPGVTAEIRYKEPGQRAATSPGPVWPASQTAICVRDVKPSFARMPSTWPSAVRGETTSSTAMSLLLQPRRQDPHSRVPAL